MALLDGFVGQSGDVLARARETRDQPGRHGIPRGQRHDDRNGRGCLLRRRRRQPPLRHEHIDLEADELRRQVGKPFYLGLRKARLVRDVLALDMAEPSQTLAKRAGRRAVGRATGGRQMTDEKYLLGRLRGGEERQ
ncbi:MAG TPA: hypothetical protein VFG27_02755 [Pseudomonadales bacterium]|nr:hypothetical protein [Pseudomonadales bacterium]